MQHRSLTTIVELLKLAGLLAAAMWPFALMGALGGVYGWNDMETTMNAFMACMIWWPAAALAHSIFAGRGR